VLVTIDTWRADRLGTGISPALDRLAAAGIRFTAARTAAPLTLPSHATILTGLLPPAHGVRVNGLDRLSDAHPTVARLLKDAGYRTAAFVGAFVLDRRFGLAQGFDTYDDQIPRDPRASERLDAERPASAVVDRAIAWLDAQNAGAPRPGPAIPPAQPAPPAPPAPFFMWVHVYDPHAPYSPPPEFLDRVERLGARGQTKEQMAYNGEIAYADAQLARLFARLQNQARADRTVMIAAGDHGEGLGEHGERTHGMLLYDSTLRVPLLIVASGRGTETHDEPVSLVDIAPTILAAAGVRRPETMMGRDLLKDVGRGEVRLAAPKRSEGGLATPKRSEGGWGGT
jgi:arylsulfatase A-like enzyme